MQLQSNTDCIQNLKYRRPNKNGLELIFAEEVEGPQLVQK